MTPRPLSFAIAGAGIGGLCTAIALRRLGFDVVVYERAPELKELGATIGLWPNAMAALDWLGLLEPVQAAGAVLREGAFRDWRGNTLRAAVLPPTKYNGYCIHRGEFHAVLHRAVPEQQLHLGRELKSYRQDEGGIMLTFADGSFEYCDALIGADGMHSAVRRQLLGDGEPVYRGYQAWRGATAPGALKVASDVAGESWGVGRRAGITPLGHGRVGWWLVTDEPEHQDDAPLGTREKLRRMFADWHDPVPQLVDATPDDGIIKTAIYDRNPAANWTDGCVTLLGDAAHPTTPNLGQGGCMAIEDAVVLARCLDGASSVHHIAAAFQRYQRHRTKRTAPVVLQSRQLGEAGRWTNPAAIALRNAMLRALPISVVMRNQVATVGYDPRTVEI
jgi:2-polyprenyl-6-methoxyphenol hydroxylase-like FAD-dependent oxidoreductase